MRCGMPLTKVMEASKGRVLLRHKQREKGRLGVTGAHEAKDYDRRETKAR